MHIKALTAALIFSFLLILPSAYSQDNTTWVYNSEHLTLENEIATKINIEKDGAAAVEYVEAEFSFYPKETPNQKIISKEYSPMPEITPAVVRFRWNSPESDVLPISLKTRLNMVNNPVRITNKIPFPLKDVPEDIQLFTNPAKIIDINQDIRALASQLAQGEDDTSIVVDKIAKWVTENIKYNLDSATAEASQKASWVLQHKEGVCDELTSLFISMVRSLGIPARFVAGIAYTNSDLFVNSWGPHGWAEVYFPGYGWIPYDVTYGQYSFVDPTHIVASIDIDAGKITTKFKIKGKNAELNIDDFTTDTKVTATGKQMSPPITIDARPVKGSVGFGSYNIIFAKIKNKANYYLPIDVYISKTDELEVIDGYKKHILLTPNEEETIYWTVRVSPALEGKYLYTFPVSVYAIGEVSDRKEFKAVKGGITLTEDRVKDTLAKFIKEEQKNFTTNLDMNCTADKEQYAEYDNVKIKCLLKNIGNAIITDLNMCMEENCEKINMDIAETKEFNYNTKLTAGLNQISIFAENTESAYFFFKQKTAYEILA